ncbi:2-keto-myo-inositol isomerase [Octadecabacter temperatus]|uniref:Xylose isomerase-like TIM barrel n=2 Tax=Octadecabacter temperatus TaxID=1458307 RepID=A0A0K0Y8G2_9RHOB|nr:Xylose isomerase-like TIM barrel [Octadecabacter temperatus]SIO45815.1 2-keto-myo-inositol isomerase [Octadecabacter temperatus]
MQPVAKISIQIRLTSESKGYLRMFAIGLNHKTMPRASTISVLDAACDMGCVGVELRNDLTGTLFDGQPPTAIRDAATSKGLRILALAEVYGFNDNTKATRAQVQSLIYQAIGCGAEAIALIPRINDTPVQRDVQRGLLNASLVALQPMFERSGITGLIEPLGFANSSLRFKSDVRAVLNDMQNPACFALIHDTFHHALAGETEVFAKDTKIVHISGVTNPTVAFTEMTDAHRGLVDDHDRLGNIEQIASLRAQGYDGPFSFEAFSDEVHALKNPISHIAVSTKFITSQIAEREA